MIIYNVTVSLADESIHEEWLQWMKNVHLPEVMRTGKFISHRILRLLNEEQDGITYAIQYTAESLEKYTEYQQQHAPALQADTRNRYGDKVLAFRTLLEVVE